MLSIFIRTAIPAVPFVSTVAIGAQVQFSTSVFLPYNFHSATVTKQINFSGFQLTRLKRFGLLLSSGYGDRNPRSRADVAHKHFFFCVRNRQSLHNHQFRFFFGGRGGIAFVADCPPFGTFLYLAVFEVSVALTAFPTDFVVHFLNLVLVLVVAFRAIQDRKVEVAHSAFFLTSVEVSGAFATIQPSLLPFWLSAIFLNHFAKAQLFLVSIFFTQPATQTAPVIFVIRAFASAVVIPVGSATFFAQVASAVSAISSQYILRIAFHAVGTARPDDGSDGGFASSADDSNRHSDCLIDFGIT